MGLKNYKAITPNLRERTVSDFEEITSSVPEKKLLVRLKSKAGRNNQGRVTVNSRGGGVKRLYRLVDFKRDKDNINAEVKSIEYDPYRSARIALIQYNDGEKRYILAPFGIKVGSKVASGENVDINPGNSIPLKNIPVGTIIHAVELRKGQGAKLGRSAGISIQLMSKDEKYAIIKLPSGEQRMIDVLCRATIGQLGNFDERNISLGGAGRKRWLGRRPKVRGAAKNPVDHPHGGGEGKAPIGKPSPVNARGRATLGVKTRNRKAKSNKYIIVRRKKKVKSG